jgi:arginase
MERAGIDDSIDRALTGTDAVYVALDLDVLDPSEVDVLIPEPDGPSADEIEALLRDVANKARIAGIGVTGLLATERNAALAVRMLAAAGF